MGTLLNKLSFAFTILLIFGNSLSAQINNIPLSAAARYADEKILSKSRTPVNTGFKPLLYRRCSPLKTKDSLRNENETQFFKKHRKNWFNRKLFFENFVEIYSQDFSLTANPIIDLRYKQIESSGETYTLNTRGLELKGRLGSKTDYYTSFKENQGIFRPALDSFIRERLVVPGQGARKDFKENGHDYASASGYISYAPIPSVNLQLGRKKHFIGEGYRSMLLSDNAFNYPFAEFSWVYQGFQFNTVFAQFEDFEKIYYEYHRKKHAAFNYLSYNINNRAELGVFEGVIYQSIDTADYSYHLPTDFFIPIPGVRSLANKQNSEQLTLVGLNTKIIPFNYVMLYAQSVFQFNSKGVGFQVGVKCFDLFFNRLSGHSLFVQAEYNSANGNLYAQPQGGYNSWSHYNQEIAHPAGTNFNEILLHSEYRYKRFKLSASYFSIEKENKNLTIFLSEEDIKNTSPEIENFTLTRLRVGYTINPSYQLELFAGLDIRNQTQRFILTGIRTNIYNFYTDFL
ncbi:MAG: hypothetical protein U9N85_12915 [Bacteroidota bacterium]|nr:hypothetical protein [Bacteroidota bacterium]